MNLKRTWGYISRPAQLLLGFVFIISAGIKGTDPIRFGRQLEILAGTYVSSQTATWITLALTAALALITVELLLGALLVSGYRARPASLCSLSLLTAFLVGIMLELLSGRSTDCGCFGALWRRSLTAALVEDAALVLVAVMALRAPAINRPARCWTTAAIVLCGMLWSGAFHVFPPPWAALRTGSPWREISAEPPLPSGDGLLVWLIDPKCLQCQELVQLVNRYAACDRLPPLVAITSASAGRIAELRWDYEPDFEIARTNDVVMERIFLASGSLILKGNGRVLRIWRASLLPDSPEAILREAR